MGKEKKEKKPGAGKRILKEFEEFISRGNVMNLAIGVIIGNAFTAIVNSVVKDLFMPFIGLITGGLDFSELKIPLGEGEKAAALTYGNLISAVLNFFIIAICLFFIVKAFNKMSRLNPHNAPPEEAQPTTKTCPFCGSTVAINAVRCPNCTTVLVDEKGEAVTSFSKNGQTIKAIDNEAQQA